MILDRFQTTKQVDRWLLVTGRRILEVRLSTLKLKGITVVLKELEGDILVERRTSQTVICVFGPKEAICAQSQYVPLTEILVRTVGIEEVLAWWIR